MGNTPTMTNVGIRLENKLKAQLQREADSQHRTLSNLIAVILIQHCERKQQGQARSASHMNGNGHDKAKSAYL